MKGLNEISRIYFIGIGGIGMSALARYFHFHGKLVSGYDKTSTLLTRELEQEGIAIHYTEDLSQAPKDADLVVFTPAIPAQHAELVFYKANGYTMMKRSEVLGLITESSFTIGVAGTHGKTTITTMIAHLLRHSGYGCNAFLGGISVNYNSNFWSNERKVSVVEADEYDRSFLKLSPDIAVITAMDADHLDIYGTAASVEQAFIDYSARIKAGGALIKNAALVRGNDLKGDTQIVYGRSGSGADIYAANISMHHGSYQFDVVQGNWKLEQVVLHMGGMHNVENVTAAIAVAHRLGIADEKIKEAVEAFKGVKRRFEYIVKEEQLVYIDDYAHHPEELRALISGARGLFPDMHCTVIFQPHLFTRTRDFADGFADVLGTADEVLLLPIYPARELPIEGVNSELLLGRMNGKQARVIEKAAVTDWVARQDRKGKLIITAGAGDIDTLVGPIKDILNRPK